MSKIRVEPQRFIVVRNGSYSPLIHTLYASHPPAAYAWYAAVTKAVTPP
ncbi:MAG: hypothetical protein LBD58_01775 [Treponema sp.]|nr:hypothetical protein [Treponema sp.]